MLVHKATMGVLGWYWTGRYRADATGERYPLMAEYTLRTEPGFSPAEWWEVPADSRLGRALLASYPYCDPVTDRHGGLTDVERHRAEPKEAPTKTTEKRRRQRRRSGAFAAMLEHHE